MDGRKVNESDLRARKSYKALHDAMFELLNHQKFNSITVHDVCEKALISRATFYVHFRDKYDLLDCLLMNINESIIEDISNYDVLEREVNRFVNENKKFISNVVKDANSETMALLRKSMSYIAALAVKREIGDETSPQNVIFFNVIIGGLVNQLRWMVKNNYPENVKMVNKYMYEMLKNITRWDAEQDELESGETKR